MKCNKKTNNWSSNSKKLKEISTNQNSKATNLEINSKNKVNSIKTCKKKYNKVKFKTKTDKNLKVRLLMRSMLSSLKKKRNSNKK